MKGLNVMKINFYLEGILEIVKFLYEAKFFGLFLIILVVFMIIVVSLLFSGTCKTGIKCFTEYKIRKLEKSTTTTTNSDGERNKCIIEKIKK